MCTGCRARHAPRRRKSLTLGLARRYSYANAPVQKELSALEVGAAVAFLCSPLASAGAPVLGHALAWRPLPPTRLSTEHHMHPPPLPATLLKQ